MKLPEMPTWGKNIESPTVEQLAIKIKRKILDKMSYFPVWFILAARLFHLSLVRSWFVPDEYWQSLEIAHNIVFGYGYLTWEWAEGIRSYLYVAFVAAQYHLLKVLHLDHVQLLIFVPRLVQTLFSTLADLYLIRWITLMTSRSVATLAGIFTLASACVAYCATRTLINTLEMNLTCFGLYFYPWQHVKRKNDRAYLWIVVITCLVRPTSCILWLPLCLNDIVRSSSPWNRFLYHFLPVGVLSLAFSTLLDSRFHQAWTFTPWNFLRVNIISGVSAHYSVQPWYWYFTSGIPCVLGSLTFPFYCYIVRTVYQGKCHHAILFGTLVWTLLVYSCIGHKEFRFLLSLWPIMLLYVSLQVYSWLNSVSSGWVYVFIAIAIIIETTLLVFLSLFHQVGVINVMPHLRVPTSDPSVSVLFLMPCHSTPLYSHLHVNISTRFLTCEPHLSSLPPSSPHLDEADWFYKDPLAWLRDQYEHSNEHGKDIPKEDSSVREKEFLVFYSNERQTTHVTHSENPNILNENSNRSPYSLSSKNALPDIVVCFDVLVPTIHVWLQNQGFVLKKKLYHTLLPLDSRVGHFVMLFSKSLDKR